MLRQHLGSRLCTSCTLYVAQQVDLPRNPESAKIYILIHVTNYIISWISLALSFSEIFEVLCSSASSALLCLCLWGAWTSHVALGRLREADPQWGDSQAPLGSCGRPYGSALPWEEAGATARWMYHNDIWERRSEENRGVGYHQSGGRCRSIKKHRYVTCSAEGLINICYKNHSLFLLCRVTPFQCFLSHGVLLATPFCARGQLRLRRRRLTEMLIEQILLEETEDRLLIGSQSLLYKYTLSQAGDIESCRR